MEMAEYFWSFGYKFKDVTILDIVLTSAAICPLARKTKKHNLIQTLSFLFKI